MMRKIALILIILFIATPAQGSNSDILEFVKQEYKFEGDAPLPMIVLVDQLTLWGIWLKINQHEFERWDEMGYDYLERSKKIKAFYHIKSKIIYIGNWFPDCRIRSLIAHELTHYLQDLKGLMEQARFEQVGGVILEMWAQTIEERYYNKFCND